jgi:hypothetical protein
MTGKNLTQHETEKESFSVNLSFEKRDCLKISLLLLKYNTVNGRC